MNETDAEKLLNSTEEYVATLGEYENEKEKEFEEFEKSKEYHEMESEAKKFDEENVVEIKARGKEYKIGGIAALISGLCCGCYPYCMARKIKKEREEKSKYKEQRDDLEFRSTYGSGGLNNLSPRSVESR
jgi:hypothetical protein